MRAAAGRGQVMHAARRAGSAARGRAPSGTCGARCGSSCSSTGTATRGFMHTVREFRRWSSTLSASPACWVKREVVRQPATVEARQPDVDQRQPRSEVDGERDHEEVDRDPGARLAIRRVGARSSGMNVASSAVSRPAACRMHTHDHVNGVPDADDIEHQPQGIGRAHREDLAVAADDDRVGVVPGVAPAPERRLLHVHERRQLVERVVEPGRPECRPVSGLVPAGIRYRSVQNPVARGRRARTPSCPRTSSRRSREREQREPDQPCRGSPGSSCGASAPSCACGECPCGTTRPPRGPAPRRGRCRVR